MKKYVLDTHAILAYLEGEESGRNVINIFDEAVDMKAELYMCVINWGEVYYIALRESGKERADLYRKSIEDYSIKIINADKELTLVAAKYKAHYKMSYADAFAAGLAETQKAVLVTGDKEFRQVDKFIKIKFI